MQPEMPENQQPVHEFFKRVWEALRRRPLQKLGALLIAVAFWAIVIASDPNLLVEKTIMNAPVTVTGQEALRSKGLTVMDDITSGTITVKLRVEVRQADYDDATADTFTPRLDLSSQITSAGENQQVYFTVASNNYGQVLSIEPESVTLNVEEFTQRSRVPVVIEQTGEAGEPIYVQGATADPSQVVVSGPKSLIDSINRAVVELPLSSLSASRTVDSVSSLITLEDADGKLVSSPQLRITSDGINVDSVRIDMYVYPTKDVPVQLESAITGIPAHGYRVTDVRIVPEAVIVAADQETLDELEALYVASPIDIDGLSAGTSATVSLRPVTNAIHTAASEVTVEVDIVPSAHVHVYIDMPVTVMGVDSSVSATLDHQTMDVIVHGDYDQVQALGKDDITLYVDATDLEEGTYQLAVQCIANGTDAFTFEPEYPRLTLTIGPPVQGPPSPTATPAVE